MPLDKFGYSTNEKLDCSIKKVLDNNFYKYDKLKKIWTSDFDNTFF